MICIYFDVIVEVEMSEDDPLEMYMQESNRRLEMEQYSANAKELERLDALISEQKQLLKIATPALEKLKRVEMETDEPKQMGTGTA
jgi:hypothetical protein